MRESQLISPDEENQSPIGIFLAGTDYCDSVRNQGEFMLFRQSDMRSLFCIIITSRMNGHGYQVLACGTYTTSGDLLGTAAFFGVTPELANVAKGKDLKIQLPLKGEEGKGE